MIKVIVAATFLFSFIAIHAGQSHDSKLSEAIQNIDSLRQRSDERGRRAFEAFALDTEDKSQRTKMLLYNLHLVDSQGNRSRIGQEAYYAFGTKNRAPPCNPPTKNHFFSNNSCCWRKLIYKREL